MAITSQGIELKRGTRSGSNVSYTVISNLMGIPDLSGSVETLEITTLGDNVRKYRNGIKSWGDTLEFEFLYNTTQFNTLAACEAAESEELWLILLPDGNKLYFSGYCSVRLNGVGVGEVLTFTLSIRPSSVMEWNKIPVVLPTI